MDAPFKLSRFGAWRFAAVASSGDTTAPAQGALWTVFASGSPAARIVNTDGYDPYDRGTFWGKWLARNPYHSAYRCRIYEGFLGDDVADMRVRNYVIDRIEGPTNGQVTVVAKDLFSIIEEQKAVAPFASIGELFANLTGSPATFVLSPAGIGNVSPELGGYSTITNAVHGHVAIGDEIIEITRVADTCTVILRAALNTVASDHKQEDLVQLVLSYTTQLAVDIAYDLALNYTSLESADLPKADWDLQAVDLTALYTARIAKPTPVNQLLGELSEQVGFTLWPDVGTGQIHFAALRAKAPTAVVTDDAWIVGDSLSVKPQAERRASQVWVYYAQIDPTVDIEERKNFRSRVVTVDLAAEGGDQFGVPAIKEIFSRWIPQFGRGLAIDLGERVIAMFRNPPLEASFRLHASRAGDVSLASYFVIETADVQDDTGAVLPVTLAAVEIERGENELEIVAQQVKFATVSATGERQIVIENDVYNINLRTIHDSLFAVPVGTVTIRFVVVDGFTVGSTSTGTYAMQTGDWPTGVALFLDNPGRIEGMGGAGGIGDFIGFSPGPGLPGGNALLVTYPISIDNTGGEIWAGGGGGGGGGAGNPGIGGGGGGGAGTNAGQPRGTLGLHGSAGTSTTGGTGGAGTGNGGAGGGGGGPGLAGAAGTAGALSGAGAGGAAGNYVTGSVLVTWLATGDRRGGVA